MKHLSIETLFYASAAITVIPLLIGCTTCFLKVSIVLGVLRSAFGVQHLPGRSAEFCLAIGITFFVMQPVFEKIYLSYSEYDAPISSMNVSELTSLADPLIMFISQNTGQREKKFFDVLQRKRGVEESLNVLFNIVPAFVLSELRRGFTMGISILIPFLLVDILVAVVLVGLGINMLTPSLVSLPLKFVFFVAADGWLHLVNGLVLSYS